MAVSGAMSFRSRIMWASALAALGILAVFAATGSLVVHRSQLQHLDTRLCMEVRRLSEDGVHDPAPESIGNDIAMKLGVADAGAVMFERATAPGAAPSRNRAWMDGGVPAADAWTHPRAADGDEEGGRASLPRCRFADGAGSSAGWRYVQADPGALPATLAVRIAAVDPDLRHAFQSAALVLLPVALALIAVSAWLLARYAMRPVERLQAAMGQITSQALDHRLPLAGEDREFQTLIGAYNAMLERLESSFLQASRFAADAAHELRTPLTILQGQLEGAIHRAEGRQVQSELGELLEEVFRLTSITRKLLVLAQADAGRLQIAADSVMLDRLVEDCLADIELSGIPVDALAKVQRPLRVKGDAVLLGQLLNNLFANALRHGRSPGWIQVEARRGRGDERSQVLVDIRNGCQPVNAEQRAQFFRRFFRADPGHSRAIGGSGLGLSLSREIARAHGGDLTLQPSADDEVHLRLWLPAADAPGDA